MNYIIYLIGILLGILILVFDKLQMRKGIQVKKSDRLEVLTKSRFRFFNSLINKSSYVIRYKETLTKKLNLLNDKSREVNERLAVLILGMTFLVFTISSLVFFFIFRLWYIFLTIGTLIAYLFLYGVNMYIAVQRNKIQRQFPEALQTFTDLYITTKNIRTTLIGSYKKMPDLMQPVFEKLYRSLSSSHKFEEYLLEFAESLDYVWGYAFVELLIISYEGAGDIDEELLILNELVNEDILAYEETSSELASNKTLFFILNIATLIAFIFNITSNPLGKEMYFYTTTGGNLILVWVISIVIGIVTSHLMEQI